MPLSSIQVTMITLSLQIQLLKRFNKKVPKISGESGSIQRQLWPPSGRTAAMTLTSKF